MTKELRFLEALAAVGSRVGEVRDSLPERLPKTMGNSGDRLRSHCLHPQLCNENQLGDSLNKSGLLGTPPSKITAKGRLGKGLFV